MGKAKLLSLLSAFLLFLSASHSSAQNVVTNGDFEGTTFAEYGDTLPSSWTLSPVDTVSLSNCNVSSAVNAATDLGPESGTHYMAFMSRESDGSQDCLWTSFNTVAGRKYLVTFWVAITGGTINSTSFLDPEWDVGGANDTFMRNAYYYPPSPTTGPVPYQMFSFIETASKSSTGFYFHGVDAAGSSSGGAILVDNFSVVPAVDPAFTSAAPTATATEGTAYNFTVTASGTPAPTFSVPPGALPTGLTLSSTGAISGTPSALGTFTGTITASNGVSPAATQNFSITVVSSYSAWASQEGLSGNQALQTAVVSPDGITNLSKYALGLNPFTTYNPGNPNLPQVQIQKVSGADYLTLTFTGAATDVTYTVQATDSLSTGWTTIQKFSSNGTAPGPTTVQDTQAITVSPSRVMRLIMTNP